MIVRVLLAVSVSFGYTYLSRPWNWMALGAFVGWLAINIAALRTHPCGDCEQGKPLLRRLLRRPGDPIVPTVPVDAAGKMRPLLKPWWNLNPTTGRGSTWVCFRHYLLRHGVDPTQVNIALPAIFIPAGLARGGGLEGLDERARQQIEDARKQQDEQA